MKKNTEKNERIRKNDHSFLYWIVILAIFLRVIPVYLTRNLGIGLDDMFQYDMLARSIVTGEGYRWYAQDDLDLVENYFDIKLVIDDYDPRGVLTSFRAPLYPTFLAVVYWFFGIGSTRFFYARLIQAILGVLLVPLIYSIAIMLWPNRARISKVAAVIVAFYPMLIIYPLALATENLFFLLVLMSLFFLLRASINKKAVLFLISGLFLGLSTLTRSVILLFAVSAVLWVFFFLKQKRNAVILLVGIIVMVSPWIIRNSLLHEKLIGVESSLGYNLYVGYHPESTGTFQYGISMDLIPMLDDGLRDEIGQSKALEFIRADPARVFNLMIRRLGYFFGLEKRVLVYFYANNFFGYIPFGILILLSVILLTPFIVVSLTAVFGFTFAQWNRRNSIILILILGYLLPHILILGEARFHVMLVPIFALGSASFCSSGYPKLIERIPNRTQLLQIGLSSFLVLLLIMNWTIELYRDWQLLSALFSINGNTLYLPY